MQEIQAILEKATPEERKGFANILNAESSRSGDLTRSFFSAGKSAFARFSSDMPSYKDILYKVANKTDAPFSFSQSTEEIEVAISQHLFNKVVSKMTPEQRTEFDTQLKSLAEKYNEKGLTVGTVAGFGALTAAQLSGFGVYMLATSTLGFITGAIGLALPFAAYTAVTSTIGFIIGPVG